MSDAYEEHPAPPATAAELAPRQLAVAKLVADCLTDKQIAAKLDMGSRRVAQHVTAIAFLIHADGSKDVRRQIAIWWWKQTPDIRRDAA